MQYTLSGAHIQILINNKILKEAQGISFEIVYGEQEVRGIDTPYAQEIAVTTITVSGTISMVRQKNSGGTQAQALRPLFSDVAAGGYINLRVHDRQSGEDILLLPETKIGKESHSAQAKGMYRVQISFTAKVPYQPLDRS